jgi:DNA-binding MarR family transcriptional regulator
MSASQDFELCGLHVGEDLDHRQREVLSALSEDQKTTYSFQGLRRKLVFHQELLSRTLDRLEEENLVEKPMMDIESTPGATLPIWTM